MKFPAILLHLGIAGFLTEDGVESFAAPPSPSSHTHKKMREHPNSNLLRPFLAASVPEGESFNSMDDIYKNYIGTKTLLDAIGLTAYGSRMIYEVAELRRMVDTHSYRVRNDKYQGKPAMKKLFGIIPWKEEAVVRFKGSEKVFNQTISSDTRTGFLKYDITADTVADFIGNNTDRIGVAKGGAFILKKDSEPARNDQENGFQLTLRKLEGKKIRIVAFDDQFQDSELIYAIAINDSDKRVSLVFRGSVMGDKDWPTNLKWDQTSVNDLISKLGRKSDFITEDDVNKVSDVKLHRGFTEYLFAPLATDKDELKLYRQHWSKFDKIVATLKAIYEEKDENGDSKHADYHLCISGHSLGGALAQLMAFVVGSSDKCRHIFPMPILAVTYASPCVGNEAFSEAMYGLEEKDIVHHVRITNQGDIVPVIFSLPVFNEYVQSGCNFYVGEGKSMELGGFKNTQTFWTEVNLNALECHSMSSHQLRLFCKVDGNNAKIWRRALRDSFASVKTGKDLSLIQDTRPYADRYKDELKAELKARGLSTSGRKDELVKRLESLSSEKMG